MFGLNSLPFAAKLNLLGLTLIAICVGGMLALLGLHTSAQKEAQHAAEAEHLALMATHGIAFSISSDTESRLRFVVDSLLESGRFTYAGLYDGSGHILLEKGSLPVLGMPSFDNTNIQPRREPRDFTNSVDGKRYRERVVPIFAGSSQTATETQARGYVRLAIAESPRPSQAYQPLLFSLVIIALAALLHLGLVRRLTAPLHGLISALDAVAQGQTEILPESSAHSEFDQLVQGFNAMATRLKESRREVVSFQLTLEDKVRARTGEITQARERAELSANAHKARSEYLNGMSLELRAATQDLRQQLDPILRGELSPRQRSALEGLSRSSQGLLALIDEALETKSGERDHYELDCIDFDPRETLAELCEAQVQAAQHRRVELIVHVEEEVPHALRGDPGRLFQVVQSLLCFVLRQIRDADLVLRVRAPERDALSVLLSFEIASKGTKHQAVSYDTEPEEPSRGLLVSRHLIEHLGGVLEIHHRQDTEPSLTFSCRCEVREQATPAADQRRDQLKGLRVLVVDDKDASREMLNAQLTAWGMHPEFARDGHEALVLMQRSARPFRLALANMIMAGMDGIEFARKLGELKGLNQTRVVLMAATHHRINTRKARFLGIRAVVSRPLHSAKLLETLCRVMEESSPLEDLSSLPEGALHESLQFDARVLVAEDNPVNQAVAESMLENLGCRILLANNGCEAVEMSTQTTCDLILMDIQMPEMDGIEAMKRIRNSESARNPPRHTPMVAVTAHAIPGDRENYIALGMDDYLSKPFDQDQLTALLSRWLVPRGSMSRRVREVAVTGSFSGAIDPNVLAKLRAMESSQSPNIVEKLIQMFQEDSPRIVHNLHDAVAHGDADTARRALHTLKSSSANLGARALSELCTRMELMARNKELDKLVETLVDLHCEYERVLIALAQEHG